MRPFSAVFAAAAVFAIYSVVPAATAAVDDNWPQWRGPGGRGVAQGSYVEEWSPEKNIAWKVPVEGRGHSSPVIWGSHLFLTTSIKGEQVPGRTAPDHLGFDLKPGYLHPDSEAVDYKHTLKVLAYDATSGKLLWEQTAYDGLMYDNRHKSNTYASSTIATDGKLLYAFFEAAGVYAYDFSGKLVWKASIGDVAKAGMGPGTSPLIWEDLLILQNDQEMGTGSAIIALDRFTGKEVWRAERTTRRSWATPIVVNAGSRPELIASGAEMVAGYDPRTGKELWRAPGVRSHPIPSAVAGHGLVFLTAGSGAKRAFGIRPGGDGDITDTDRVVWQYQKGTAYTASPVLHGDYLYLMTDGGIMTCLDAKTGTVVYEGGRPPIAVQPTRMVTLRKNRICQTE